MLKSIFQMYSKFDLRTATYGEVKQIDKYDIAILPWGATEPYNGHLPYCTDVLASTAIGCEVAEEVERQGIHRLLIINGHGGNSFKGFIRDLSVEKPGFLIVESDWSKVSKDTGIGDPSKANSEKGARYSEAVVDKIADMVIGICTRSLY